MLQKTKTCFTQKGFVIFYIYLGIYLFRMTLNICSIAAHLSVGPSTFFVLATLVYLYIILCLDKHQILK